MFCKSINGVDHSFVREGWSIRWFLSTSDPGQNFWMRRKADSRENGFGLGIGSIRITGRISLRTHPSDSSQPDLQHDINFVIHDTPSRDRKYSKDNDCCGFGNCFSLPVSLRTVRRNFTQVHYILYYHSLAIRSWWIWFSSIMMRIISSRKDDQQAPWTRTRGPAPNSKWGGPWPGWKQGWALMCELAIRSNSRTWVSNPDLDFSIPECELVIRIWIFLFRNLS